MNHLWVGDIDLRSRGLIINTPPTKPGIVMRAEAVTIPGRDGVKMVYDGAIDESQFDFIVFLPREYAQNLSALRAKLSGEIEFSYEDTTAYYKGRVSKFDMKPLDFGDGYTGTLTIMAVPLKYLSDPEAVTITASGQSVENPYDAYSCPEIVISGSGNSELSIGDINIAITGQDADITIDTEERAAYESGEECGGKVTGDFPTLPPGETEITFSGGITAITINPRWRRL